METFHKAGGCIGVMLGEFWKSSCCLETFRNSGGCDWLCLENFEKQVVDWRCLKHFGNQVVDWGLFIILVVVIGYAWRILENKLLIGDFS